MQKVVSYRIDDETKLFEIFVLSAQDQEIARQWYANKGDNEATLEETDAKLARMRRSRNRAGKEYVEK